MRKIYAAVITVALFALSGCATVQPLNSVDGIRLISKVEVPPVAYFRGGASNFEKQGWMGAAFADTDRPFDEVLTDFIKKKNINIGDIVSQQFSAKLNKTAFAGKISDAGSHQLKIYVEGYGLGKQGGFSDIMRPSIKVEMTLTDAKGSVVIKKKAAVGGVTTELPSRTLEEWMKDPEALKAAYIDAAARVIDMLLKEYELP